MAKRDPSARQLAQLDKLEEKGMERKGEGDFKGARTLFAKVYERRQRFLGSEHPDTLAAAGNLALSLRDLGDFHAAHGLLYQLLSVCRRVFGPEHPKTLAVASSFALTLCDQGIYEPSHRLLKWVVSAYKRVLGPTHRETLSAANNLAQTLRRGHDDYFLKRQIEPKLKGYKYNFGPEFPGAGRHSSNFATRLHRSGLFEAARQCEEEALREFGCALGPEHPQTLIAANNLAITLHSQGDYVAAVRLARQVLKARKRVLGPDDLDTQISASNLAVMLHNQGDHEAAWRLEDGVLAAQRRASDSKHPDTLSSDSGCATSRRLHEERLRVCQNTLGLQHPQTLDATSRLASILNRIGDREAAIRLWKFVLESRWRVGERSSSAIASDLENLAIALLDHGEIEEAFVTVQATMVSFRTLGDGGSYYLALLARLAAKITDQAIFGEGSIGVLTTEVSVLQSASSAARILCERSATGRTRFGYVLELHRSLFRLCLTHSPERCASVVAALHGNEAWAAALAQPYTEPDLKVLLNVDERRWLDLRGRLSAVRSLIEEFEARLSLQRGQGLDDLPAADSSPARDLEELKQEELRLLDHWKVANQALVVSSPRFAAALGSQGQSGAELCRRLAPGHAAVIMVDAETHHALVLFAGGNQEVLDLADLGPLRMLETDAEATRTTHAVGLRDWWSAGLDGQASNPADRLMEAEPDGQSASGHDAKLDAASQGEAWQTAKQQMNAWFWRPLQALGAQTSHWHIITGPGQHAWPLDIGRPEEISAHYYCGLPAFVRLQDAPHAAAPGLGPVDICVDAASATGMPIPFVRCEAELVCRLLPGSRVVDSAQLLATDAERSDRLLLACHGQTLGTQDRQRGVLVLDAARGLTLDPVQAGQLGSGLSELVASACLGGVVGAAASGDAVGMVPALQLRGVGAVVASLAPVADFYMPLLAGLYWHARKGGVAPAAALAQAKRSLRAGDLLAEVSMAAREAYAPCMAEVLVLAARAPEGEPAAYRAAQSVGGWCLPPSVRSSCFGQAWIDGQSPGCQALVQDHCQSPAAQRRLIDQVLAVLLGPASQRPADAQLAIDRLCAFMVCYGGQR